MQYLTSQKQYDDNTIQISIWWWLIARTYQLLWDSVKILLQDIKPYMVMVQMINKLILRNPNPVNLLIASYNEETKSCMVQNCSYSYLVGIIGAAQE